jgi:hypothetical protein
MKENKIIKETEQIAVQPAAMQVCRRHSESERLDKNVPQQCIRHKSVAISCVCNLTLRNQNKEVIQGSSTISMPTALLLYAMAVTCIKSHKHQASRQEVAHLHTSSYITSLAFFRCVGAVNVFAFRYV